MDFFENGSLEDVDSLFETHRLNPESDFVSCEIEPNLLRIYYGIYWKVNDYLFYHGNVKEQVKKHSKVWIILSFFALSYLVFKKDPNLPVNQWLEVLFMELAILTCVCTLWFKDCFIINRNIQALFTFNASLEKKYPEFGASYNDTKPLLNRKFLDPNTIDGGFYLNIIICLQFVVLVSLFMLYSKYLVIGIFIAIFAVFDCLIMYISKHSGHFSFRSHKALQRGELHSHIRNRKDFKKKK